MSSSSAELRNRISSIESAKKIVSALRLVAAARIRASSNAALRSRPFAEELQRTLGNLIRHIARRQIDIAGIAQQAPPFSLAEMHGPFLADPMVQRALIDRMYLAVITDGQAQDVSHLVTLLTVISADRKFCGSYNKDVISRAVIRIRQLEAVGSLVELVLVGAISRRFFSRHFPRLHIRLHTDMASPTGAEQIATTLSHGLLSEFIAGGVERVEVVYTRFISLLSSAPSARTLLPLTPTGIEAVGDEIFQLSITSRNGRIVPTRVDGRRHAMDEYTSDAHAAHRKADRSPLLSMSDEEAILLLNSMLPMYVTSQLVRMLREAVASEQVSRLAAMTAATDNAHDLIQRLRTRYNRERQARITKEIIEVISSTI